MACLHNLGGSAQHILSTYAWWQKNICLCEQPQTNLNCLLLLLILRSSLILVFFYLSKIQNVGLEYYYFYLRPSIQVLLPPLLKKNRRVDNFYLSVGNKWYFVNCLFYSPNWQIYKHIYLWSFKLIMHDHKRWCESSIHIDDCSISPLTHPQRERDLICLSFSFIPLCNDKSAVSNFTWADTFMF